MLGGQDEESQRGDEEMKWLVTYPLPTWVFLLYVLVNELQLRFHTVWLEEVTLMGIELARRCGINVSNSANIQDFLKKKNK